MSASSPIADPILSSAEKPSAGIKPAAARGPFQDGADEPSFADFIDLINPLQHIPVISTIYRAITGDEIGAVPRILGDTLFGGPTGLLMAVANEVIKADTGKDIGEQALAYLFPESDGAPVHLAGASGTSDLPKAVADRAAGEMDEIEMRPFTSLDDKPVPPSLAFAAQPTLPFAVQPLAPQIVAEAAPLSLTSVPVAPPVLPAQIPLESVVTGGQFVPWSPPPLAAAHKALEAEPQPVQIALAQPLDDNRFQPKRPRAGEGSAPSHGKLFANAAPHLIPRNDSDMVRRAMAAQGLSAQDHPMIKAADPTGADGAWMMRSMSQALDRYRDSAKLGPAGDKL
jgi:hypothetical protein